MNQWLKAGVPQPHSCTVDLTEACNLNCEYCFTHSCHERREISEEMMLDIIDWWVPQTKGAIPGKPTEFACWGGEPLLRFKFWQKSVEYAKHVAEINGIDIVFGGTTNGLLYTPDKVEWCAQNKSLMMISLDGIQPSHDRFRKMPSGQGSWKVVDKNARDAIKLVPSTKLRMSIHPETLDYFYESVLYFHEDLGAMDTAFSPVFEADWTLPEVREKLAEQFDLIVNYMVKRRKEGRAIRIKHLDDTVNHLSGKISGIQPPCGAGRQYVGWSVDGFAYPCHRFNKHGQTTEQRMMSPIVLAKPKGSEFVWIPSHFRERLIEYAEFRCNKCIECNATICNGSCPAVNYDLMGDTHIPPESVCAFQEEQDKAGQKLFDLMTKENLFMPEKPQQGRSCVCYNMCYAEGTDQEIMMIDRRNSDYQCLCNYSNYAAEEHNGQTRPYGERQRFIKKMGDIIKRIYATRHLDKTKEEIEMEDKLISQFFEYLQ